MKKLYVSPIVTELELENILYSSDEDQENVNGEEPEGGWGDFDKEDDFS